MRTLFPSFRVSDLDRSLAHYRLLGYAEIGRLTGDDETLVMLRFPDDTMITLELVHRPADGPVEVGTGFHHLAIQTDDLAETRRRLAAGGLAAGPIEFPGGPDGPKIAWLTDPDGYRAELVEWPPGHPFGMVDADFA
jgi:lactoylglutathione lyase